MNEIEELKIKRELKNIQSKKHKHITAQNSDISIEKNSR
jgi:hypothetical protein